MKFTKFGLKTNGLVSQKYEDYMPLHNGILVAEHNKEETSNGGIIVSDVVRANMDATDENDLAYEVLKVGPEVTNVKVGDYIFYETDSRRIIHLSSVNKEGKEEVSRFRQAFEHWVLGILRPGGNPEDLVPSERGVQ